MNSIELERKLKIERIERCMNCKTFTHCSLVKDEIVCCARYQEVDEREQVVVIGLEHYCGLTVDHKNKRCLKSNGRLKRNASTARAKNVYW